MTTMFKQLTNNAAGTLAGSIDDNDLSFSLNSGQGAEYPSSGAFWVTLYDTDPEDGEMVLCDSRSSDTFTVNASGRGAQGSTAQSWPAGTNVALLLTAASITELQTAVNAIENGSKTLSSVTASGAVAAGAAVTAVGNVTAQGGYGSTGTTIGENVETNGNLVLDGFFSMKRSTSVTISAGSITPTSTCVVVDTEGAAATDDLDTITAPGPTNPTLLVLRTLSSTRDVTIRHLGGGTGNIRMKDMTNFAVANTSSRVVLEWDPSTSLWCCWIVSLN